jgi:hypothetical protein
VKGDEIDDAIDAVVRQIMGTEPPAGLRARVLNQLAAPTRRSVATMPRLAAAAAFAVCLIGGFLVTRDRPAPIAEPGHRAGLATGVTPSPSAIAQAPAAGAGVAEPRRRDASRVLLASHPANRSMLPSDDERLVSAMSIDDVPLAVAIAPLQPMPAITATPLESSLVRIKDITIHPLRIEPVEIDPPPSTPR